MNRSGLRIVLLSRSARASDSPAWGLGVDSKLLEQICREAAAGGTIRIASVDHIDPMSFYGGPRKPQPVDIQIHLEVPCRAAWKWAKINIVVVNPEWWPTAAWNWVLAEKGGADYFVFKSQHARSLFPELENKRTRILAWRAAPEMTRSLHETASLSFLYLIGASANKLAAARIVLSAWRTSWPPVTVVGTTKVLDDLRETVSGLDERGIILQSPFASDMERIAAQSKHMYHIVASVAEGFGYTFAEAAAVGALPLWTGLPVYTELWGNVLGEVGRIAVSDSSYSGMYRDGQCIFTEDDVANAVSGLMSADNNLRSKLRSQATSRIKLFREGWRGVLEASSRVVNSAGALTVPPKPMAADTLPHVAVVTLTHNRPRWFHNMSRNILLSDYPKDKLTWIVVDDGDFVAGGRVDADIMKFQSKNPHIAVRYISLTKPMALGAKRNKACSSAPSEASVFIMMDDDDHYPAGSIAGRVAWLNSTSAECVYCSTLPMYDCTRYISAINVPPLDLAPAERISEASLCFKRSFWEEQGFPDTVSVAEGEAFISGRVEKTAEIPPEGIIVSFLHGKNATSRRVPEESEPNGCHYGFDDEFFTYISELGGAQ